MYRFWLIALALNGCTDTQAALTSEADCAEWQITLPDGSTKRIDRTSADADSDSASIADKYGFALIQYRSDPAGFDVMVSDNLVETKNSILQGNYADLGIEKVNYLDLEEPCEGLEREVYEYTVEFNDSSIERLKR